MSQVIRTTLRVWRAHALQLWVLAAMVLAPLAAFEMAGYHFAVQITTSRFDPATAFVNLFVILVFEIGSVELEAAAAEKMVGNDLHGDPLPSLGRFLRDLPWLPLILATLAYEIAVALGLVLLVVPGVMALVYLSLYGPAIVVERLGVWGSLRRSASLVRGNFWRMLVLVALVIAIGEGVTGVVDRLLDGTEHWIHVLGFYTVDVLLTPLQGVGVAVVYFVLAAMERDATPDASGPAEAGPVVR